MIRMQKDGSRTVKGKTHYSYLVEDAEIARSSGVKVGAVVIARMRGEFSTFDSLVLWILERKIKRLRRRG